MTVALFLTLAMCQSTDAAARVVWIDAATGDAAPCSADRGRWTCPATTARGLVALIGVGRVALADARGVDNVDRIPASIGRVVKIVPGGAGEGDLHELSLTAWKPERSRARGRQVRFQRVHDEDVHVLKLSASVFWVTASAAADRDAYLLFDGPAIGSVRVSVQRLNEDAPDVPLVVPAPLATSILGRVQLEHGGDVAAATVQLFEPLRVDPGQRLDAGTPVVAFGSTTSDSSGSFTLDRAPEAPVLLVASAGGARGFTWVTSLGPPVVVSLTPPTRARGRIVRRGLSVPGARVRFVPTADAWTASSDPESNLAEEVVAADDGSFELPLPERHEGEIQVAAADGSVARVPIPAASGTQARALELGDIAIPDPVHVVVRLLEPIGSPSCDIIAAGPIGRLGMQLVRASSAVNVYALDLPESGQWVLSAECNGTARSIVPMLTSVPPPGANGAVPAVDVRFAR